MTSHLVLSMDLQRNLDVGRYSKRKTEDWLDHLRDEDDVRNRRVPGGALLCQVKALEERVRINRRWIREKGRIDMTNIHTPAATMRTAASVTVHLPSHSSTQTATTRPNLSVMSALPTSRESPVDLVVTLSRHSTHPSQTLTTMKKSPNLKC